jgi:hypothetical protein
MLDDRLGRGFFFRVATGLDSVGSRFAITNDQRYGDGPREKATAVIFNARQVTITHPFQDEGIWRDKAQPVVQRRFFTFEPQWPDPGIKLLCGQFLLEALQTGFPKTSHGR